MEEFAGAVAEAGFELEYCQLKSDQADSAMDVLATEVVRASRFQVGSHIHHHILSEGGTLTFGLLDGPQQGTLIEGIEFHPGDLLLAKGDLGIDAVISSGFTGRVIAIDESHLAMVAEQHEFDLPQEAGTERRLRPDQRIRLEGLLRDVSQSPHLGLSASALTDVLDTELPLALLAGWSASDSRPASHRSTRRRACNRAVDYIRSSAGEVRTVQQVCQAAAVSYSTLERAFREAFGISPKQYLVQYRMSAVRQELLDLPAGLSITGVAHHWGFSHMGKFAADYKALFGELPSHTVQCRGP